MKISHGVAQRAIWRALILLLAGLAELSTFGQANQPPDFSVQVSAEVSESPPSIRLQWPQGPFSTGYEVSRRLPQQDGWQHLADLPADAQSHTDSDVEVGQRYKYQIKRFTSRPYVAHGYVTAGIDLPLRDIRGQVLLLVADSVASDLDAELKTFRADLIGDGWTVLQETVTPQDPPPAVRARIQQAYDKSPADLRMVFLIGPVPVPYSGNIAPDGHENHRGAWPADVYYGDVDGEWTDTEVDNTKAEREINWNVPGDGKFDQDEPPTAVELAVGRLDFSQMTAFSNKRPPRSQVDLLREYFHKNHEFRQRLVTLKRRALIADNFGDKGDDPVAGSAWRNFPAFFGAESIDVVEWDEFFPVATSESYLWAYASGGGTYYIAHGVGSSDDFAVNDVQVAFGMFLGSYFGDWNNESNFLRASLGSGMLLTASYSGFPHWNYRGFALGEPIGESLLRTQHDHFGGLYPPYNQGTGKVHIALMGDPTLRMHPVVPPASLQVSPFPGGADLAWDPSTDSEIVGYHVYRSESDSGPFERVTSASPTPETAWRDPVSEGDYFYMVRAVRHETSGSGTYLNPSQGIVQNASVPPSDDPAEPNSVSLALARLDDDGLELTVEAPSDREVTLEVSEDLTTWTVVQTNRLGTGGWTFRVDNPAAHAHRFYRVRSATQTGSGSRALTRP